MLRVCLKILSFCVYLYRSAKIVQGIKLPKILHKRMLNLTYLTEELPIPKGHIMDIVSTFVINKIVINCQKYVDNEGS